MDVSLLYGKGMKNLLEKMKDSGITFKGDLAFVNDWELFWSGRFFSFILRNHPVIHSYA
jgi:hypothetical protein